MEKKIYTTPALSVEEFKMSEIVCASVQEIDGGTTGLKFGGPGSGSGSSSSRAKGRDGIWDEE